MRTSRNPLIHRTNVLLNREDKEFLSWASEKTGKTEGALIREGLQTLRDKYAMDVDFELLDQIKAGWKLVKNTPIPFDWKAARDAGRKH